MMKKYMDSELKSDVRAKELFKELSLEEKMAQVVCYLPNKLTFEELEKLHPYGVGQVSVLEMRGRKTIEECVSMQRTIQKMVMDQSPHKIPAIFHMEGLAGAYIQGATSFPVGINRASSWDAELEEKVGKIIARQERALGISHIFAPVLDISRDSRLGRQGETYGEDPTLASVLGSAYIKGIQSENTYGLKSEAVAKHFTGFHNSEAGIHGANCQIDDRLLREIYAKPFQASITEAGLMGIMPSYNTINGEPISASKDFLTTLLRDDMGFNGIVVADYGAINIVHKVQKVCESSTEAGLRCMNAGMDMELPSKQCFNDELKSWFTTGKADINILDQAVLRVLTTKFRMGLFEHPFALTGKELEENFYNESDRDISKKSAYESIVMLKNNGVLPISKKIGKIAVIGCHAQTARVMFGGYTHFSMSEGLFAAKASMAGVEAENAQEMMKEGFKAKTEAEKAENTQVMMKTYPGSQVQIDDVVPESLVHHIAPTAKSLFEELLTSFPDTEITYAYGYPYIGNDRSGFKEALEIAKQADVVLLTLGGKHGTSSIATMGEGVDSTDINLPICQEEFIIKVAELKKPMVGVHFNGRPISSDAADEHLGAILEAWSPSEAGAEVIADIIAGTYNPSGKLPVSVAYNAGQIPIYYNHPNGSAWHQSESVGFANYVDMPHTPRYFFGHGLSYTSFSYNNLSIDKSEVEPDGEVKISLHVSNTGEMAGVEIVQLYLSDQYASMVRPNKELQGFVRVSLEPGEKKEVNFIVRADQMAFLDSNKNWKVEAGDMDVLIGSSSADILLEGTFKITDHKLINGQKRGFYAKTELRDL